VPPAALPVFHCRLVHRLASVDSNISRRLCTNQTIATPGETQAVLQGAVQQNALREMAAVVELGARRVPEVHAEGGLYHSSSMQRRVRALRVEEEEGIAQRYSLRRRTVRQQRRAAVAHATYSARQLFGGDWDWDAADGFVATRLLVAPLQQPLQRLVVRVQHHAVAGYCRGTVGVP
jgi:hypothetical protein